MSIKDSRIPYLLGFQPFKGRQLDFLGQFSLRSWGPRTHSEAPAFRSNSAIWSEEMVGRNENSLSRPGPWKKKFKLGIFPTKHVIPERLKFPWRIDKFQYWNGLKYPQYICSF